MLVPEIGLTPAVAGQFHHRFGDRVAILHSAFHDSERAQEWRRIRSGEASVVVATRSGVFAPVRNLGLIIVDEEHDQSYKQQETPRYHGRDVAVVRAQRSERRGRAGLRDAQSRNRYNAERGKYHAAANCRSASSSGPCRSSQLIDMRQEFLETRKQATFSRALIDAVTARLENGEQTMLLLNRRGFSSFVACRACGERAGVRELLGHADVSPPRPAHAVPLLQLCRRAFRSAARSATANHIQFLGVGSERVEDELHGAFPRGAHRAAGSRHRRRQARLRNDPGRLSRRAITTFWWARR